MKISKVLNNNTVIVKEDVNEIVLIGRGIAFKKKPGDPINPALIEKRSLHDEWDGSSFGGRGKI